MAFTTHTLTGNISDVCDEPYTAVSAWVAVEPSGDMVHDQSGGKTHMPRKVPVTVAVDGSFSVDLLDSSETGLEYRVHVEPRRGSLRLPGARSAAFTVNGATVLASAAYVDPTISEAQRLAALSDAAVAALVGDGSSLTQAALTGERVTFDPASSGLVATDVDAAIKEVAGRVIHLDATGGDQTARINAALAQAVDSTRVVRLRGDFAIIGPIVIGSDTVLDARGATLTQTAGSDCNMLQNAAVVADATRDSGITVIGGTWAKGANAGTGNDRHGLMFRRVDGLRVTGLGATSTDGKYAIGLGDCTDFEVARCDFDTASDGIHVNGPATNGHIHHITGTTGDDTVSLTGNDYAAYADVTGDITNVLIEHVDATSTVANVVKVLAGQDCLVDDITVAHVRGTSAQHGVWIGDDNGQATTDNGSHGTIRVRDVDVDGTAPGSSVVYTNMENGAQELHLSDIALTGGSGLYCIQVGVGSTGVVDKMVVERPRVADTLAGRRLVALRTASGATFRQVAIHSPRAREVSNAILLEVTPAVLESATITDPYCTATDTNSTNWLNFASGSTVGTVAVVGGQIAGGRGLADIRCAATVLLTGGLTVGAGTNGLNRVANLYGSSAVKFILGTVTVATTINRYFIINETASLTVVGEAGAVVPSTPDLIQRSASQTMRVTGRTLRGDLAQMTPQDDDLCMALVSHLTIPAGALAIYRGGWRTVYDPTDRQAFTAGSGTWKNPSPVVARPVRVRGVCGGGGGGSGRRGAAGSIRSGGGGGAAGLPFEVWLLSSDLPETVPVTVGAGGAGGAAVTANDTDGNPGGQGGATCFGAATTTYWAGSSASSVAGGRGGTATTANGGASGASGPTGGAGGSGAGASGNSSSLGNNGPGLGTPSGGGAGGGLDASNAASAGGGAGGVFPVPGSGPPGGAVNTNGTAGTSAPATTYGKGGTGGSGGGASAAGTGGNGGAGGTWGGGGGGGGASANGNASGAGGGGGDGYLEVVTF